MTDETAAASPADDGFFMPAEWAPHTRCWMQWPCRESLWGDRLDLAREAHAEVARTIGEYEPVTMIANPDSVAEVSIMCGSGVAAFPLEHDDSWVRDTGPTFLLNRAGALAGVDWSFNGWGGAEEVYDKDAAVAEALLKHLGVPRYAAGLVTEGGAIHTDGEGTLLAVESSIVNSNRNPNLSKAEIERLLLAYTGCRKLIWLPHGLSHDDTDGHVDNVACFVAPGRVVAASSDDEASPDRAALRANLEVLRNASDAAGRQLDVVELPLAERIAHEDRGPLPTSYVNFYIANGAVIVPSFDDPKDDIAYERLEDLFPGREVVQVRALDIIIGGGGIHCITQQQPKGGGAD